MKRSPGGLTAAGLFGICVCVLCGQTGPGAKPGKLPAPDKAAFEQAEKGIRSLYKSDYAKTKVADQRDFAKKLLKQGLATKDDPAARYVLLTEASRLASLGCAIQEAFRAIDTINREYTVDAVDLKMKVLTAGAKAANVPGMHRALVDGARDFVDEAIAADKYELALAALSLAEASAGKAENPNLPGLVAADVKEVREIEAAFKSSRPAAETLRTKSDDPSANLNVGSFLCFFKNQWDAGLPLLARGEDAKIAEAAKADVAKPSNLDQYIKAGDAWWDLAERKEGVAQKNLRDRASRWYELALPGLEGGNTKLRAATRVRQVLADRRNRRAVFEDPRPNFADIRHFGMQNKVPVKMIHGDEGFCFLSSVGGKFEGFGEHLGVSIGRDGHWYFNSQTFQDLSGRAVSLYEMRWRQTFAQRVTEVTWQRGRPIRLLDQSDGFCFLSFVSGRFAGGEEVGVFLDGQGDWYLGGKGAGISARAIVVQTSRPGAFRADVKQHAWSAGQGPIKMISKKEGFCFLSSVGGPFRGGGEEVNVTVEKDDFWYLSGRSAQAGLLAKAISVRIVAE